MENRAIEILQNNLDAICKAQGISRAQFARRARIPHTTMNRLFRGVDQGASPTLETLERLAAALQIDISQLLAPKGPPKVPSPPPPAHLVARQLARLVEDFMVASEAGRLEILRIAELQATKPTQ